MFSSLAKNSYQGFTVGSENIGEGIIERGYVKEFQEFLASVGIKYELVAKRLMEASGYSAGLEKGCKLLSDCIKRNQFTGIVLLLADSDERSILCIY